jgi:uncharacterized protein (TIGR00251 family)
MSVASYLQVENDRVLLHVKVQPRSSRNQIGEVVGRQLKIKITAPPVDSAANKALVRFLADLLNCPRGSVQILHGETSRHKVISVQGISPVILQEKLTGSSQKSPSAR